MALLFGSPSVCLADAAYDRQLESAVMKIVASKVGSIRGPLEREWSPPEAEPALAYGQAAEPISSDSFVTADPPALYEKRAVASMLRVSRSVMVPTAPKRQVRVIPLHH